MLGELVLQSTKQMLPQIINNLKGSLAHNTPVLFELSKKQQKIYKDYMSYSTIKKTYPEFDYNFTRKTLENKGWIDKLSLDEKKAIHGYSFTDYTMINAFLRFGSYKNHEKTEQIKEASDLISSALSKSKTTEDMIVYRQIAKDCFKNCYVSNLEDLVGLVFIDRGFLSTSKEIPGNHGMKIPYYLRIKIPKGTKAAIIKDLSYYAYEEEVLIDKNQKLLITGISKKNNNTILECELLLSPKK